MAVGTEVRERRSVIAWILAVCGVAGLWGVWDWCFSGPYFWYVSPPLDGTKHRALALVPRGWRMEQIPRGPGPEYRDVVLDVAFAPRRSILPAWLDWLSPAAGQPQPGGRRPGGRLDLTVLKLSPPRPQIPHQKETGPGYTIPWRTGEGWEISAHALAPDGQFSASIHYLRSSREEYEDTGPAIRDSLRIE